MIEYSLDEHDLWVKEVHEIYKNVKSYTEPYNFDFLETNLIIYPNVFSPKFFNNTKWYAERLLNIIGKGKSLLEIGTGTGAIAIHCYLNGISTIATDINKEAYECAKKNFETHKCNIPIYMGDVYDALPKDFEKVDYIFWNHPYNNSKEIISDNLEIAGFDYNYNSLRKYIKQASKFLKNPNKGLLIGTGGHADIKIIKRIASANKYRMHIKALEVMPLGEKTIIPNDFRIYELIQESTKDSISELDTIDKIDDLLCEFFRETNFIFNEQNAQFRFDLLSPLLEKLCPVSLSDPKDKDSFKIRKQLSDSLSAKKAEKICNKIKTIIGNPTYFAASYWSPIDNNRHTISHFKGYEKNENERYSRACALLFYLLNIVAPPKFYPAVQYILEEAPRKDGLLSYYGDMETEDIQSDHHNLLHLKKKYHDKLLEISGFSKAVDDLISYDNDHERITKDLTILMRNVDKVAVDSIKKNYKDITDSILNLVDSFIIPDHLPGYLKVEMKKWNKVLNEFFYPKDIELLNIERQNTVQFFFMLCTHALYNKACPTEMFYTFPVRVDKTCCTLTLGVDSELEIDDLLKIYHIIKSIYYHMLITDYSCLDAITRSRLAHGSVHKIRGPLSVFKEFPYYIENVFQDKLSPNEFDNIKPILKLLEEKINNSIKKISIGVNNLENFIGVDTEKDFDLCTTIKDALNLYKGLNFSILDDITLTKDIDGNAFISGYKSFVHFIFEELIYNSIKSYQYFKKNSSQKLIIHIHIFEDLNHYFVEFKDNGQGIIPKRKNEIFLSGERGEDSFGKGKGLYLIMLFMTYMQGDIVELGEYGSGVCFKLTFKKKLGYDS